MSAFLDYMDNYNHGRGIVFIGHSQGAFMLDGLLQAETPNAGDLVDHEEILAAIAVGIEPTGEFGRGFVDPGRPGNRHGRDRSLAIVRGAARGGDDDIGRIDR